MTARDPLAMAESRVASYENMLTQLKTRQENGSLNASEERLIKMLPDLMERYQKQVDELKRAAALKGDAPQEKPNAEPTEAQTPPQTPDDATLEAPMGQLAALTAGGDFT